MYSVLVKKDLEYIRKTEIQIRSQGNIITAQNTEAKEDKQWVKEKQ